LFPYIIEIAISYGVGQSDVKTIDSRGIAKATRLAMKKAVDQLTPSPDFLLVDYLFIPEIKLPQKGITHGDCLSFLDRLRFHHRKSHRDRLMVELDKIYPEYKFAEHKGYGTRAHIECLQAFGAVSHPPLFFPACQRYDGAAMKRKTTGMLGEKLAADFFNLSGVCNH